jgi:glycosyltransferase involved in cell wall biosynthesis
MGGVDVTRVAIGLPVYNGATYLEESIDAILAQTYSDFVLVISDNASTDDTEAICRRYASQDDRILYLRQATNLGAAPNYNAAYAAAPVTEYFGWIAHDDVAEPRFVEACVNVLDENPNAVLAFPVMVDIDDDSNRIGIAPTRPGLTGPDPATRMADVINQRNRNDPVFGLTRRAALDQTSLHGSYTGSDRTLMAELALRGPFIEIPDHLFAIRQHAGRSVRSGRTPWAAHVREAWFDTSRAGKVVFPKWRRLRSYLSAVRNAPLTRAERRAAYRELRNWLLDRNWKALIFDVMLAGVDLVQRIRRRFRSPE